MVVENVYSREALYRPQVGDFSVTKGDGDTLLPARAVRPIRYVAFEMFGDRS